MTLDEILAFACLVGAVITYAGYRLSMGVVHITNRKRRYVKVGGRNAVRNW